MIVHCGEVECNADLTPGDDRCPQCGSENVMVGVLTPKGTRMSAPRDTPSMRVQGRRLADSGRTEFVFTAGPGPTRTPGRRAPVAPHVKIYNDIKWNHDRLRFERREMYIDDEQDYYRQTWYNLQTGEQTFQKEGKLSDPDMHGQSARRRREAR